MPSPNSLGFAFLWRDVALCAHTPRVEREHQYWQHRLPAYFASEQINCPDRANPEIDKLRAHRNSHEKHRELGMTAQSAWDLASREKRTILRKVPDCIWWPYVWSQRALIKVGSDGRVPIGSERLCVEAAPGTKVVHCTHPTSHFSSLLNEPNLEATPRLLFTSRP